MVPPNVRFEIDDFTEPWLYKKDHFDFIHIRSLFGCVADWPAFYKECYEYVHTQQRGNSTMLTPPQATFSPAATSNNSNSPSSPNPTTAP